MKKSAITYDYLERIMDMIDPDVVATLPAEHQKQILSGIDAILQYLAFKLNWHWMINKYD